MSGYQGSPVGMFGEEVDRANRTLPDLPVVNQPGVNEELAATAVMGSQVAVTLDDCKYDGILGMWYGKGPGIDRAGDAIRHAVFASTAPHGGVVAVVGDDPSAKSSTLPSSSDATMVDLHMPLLFPGDPQEALDLARHAVALSRACGIWSGLKLVTPVADGTGTIDVHPDRVQPVIPTLDIDGRRFEPRPNGLLITPHTLDMEREFFEVRTELARAVRRAEPAQPGHRAHRRRLDRHRRVRPHLPRAPRGAPGARIRDRRRPHDRPVSDCGSSRCRSRSIDTTSARSPRARATSSSSRRRTRRSRLLVRDALYDVADRPRVWGKRDEDRHVLVPYDSLLDAERILPALRHHLGKRLGDRLAPPQVKPDRNLIPLSVNRAPFFCSGCPHNTSTRVEPGTLVGGGIGCHAMVAFMEPERTGELVGLTCMGNEGAQWIGMAPFVERDHLVQNLGDGTFFHSGSVAIRAAIAADVDITYKLLLNGTVAMTGGQDAQGAVDADKIATMLLAEGVQQVIITSDDPDRVKGLDVPDGVKVWDRSRLDEAQDAAGRGEGHDRAHPRPGVRGGEATGPQPRHSRQAGLPRRHQRADLRGLRRLRRQVELPVGAADRHAVRPQDGDPPDELQLRLLVHAGRLPGVRHGHGRPGRRRG